MEQEKTLPVEGQGGGFNSPSILPGKGWLAEIHRLDQLGLALLPVGWGNENKAPMFYSKNHPETPEDWTKVALTIDELLKWPRRPFYAVGARTGLSPKPLLAYDFDGETALELGLYPWAVKTWQVHRDNDPFRLKVLFRPTPEQIAQLPLQADGMPEFQGKTITRPAVKDANDAVIKKGEALEVFFYPGRQVIVQGEHASSGGNYFWPDGLGPEALTAPPQEWLDHAITIAKSQLHRTSTGSKASKSRNGTTRLDPCPICGRHSGPGGSGLWCEETDNGLILCMPGSTFNAEQRHGPLQIGQVVDGYALTKRTPMPEGDCLTFCIHRTTGNPDLRPRHRRAIHNLQRSRAGVTI